MISRFRKPPLIIVAFLLPSIAGSALFFGAPLFETARRSLTDDVGNRFVGLGNYAAVLTSEAFRLAAGNTAAFMAISVPALLALSLGCALLLRRSSAVTSLVKSILLLPIALPVCAIALLISFAFGPEGWVNGTLASIGIDPVDWLGGPAAFGVLIVEYLWKNLGYATVLWLAALATIPERLEGAARLDGASRWQRLTRITLPLLAPTVRTRAAVRRQRLQDLPRGLPRRRKLPSPKHLSPPPLAQQLVRRSLLGQIGRGQHAFARRLRPARLLARRSVAQKREAPMIELFTTVLLDTPAFHVLLRNSAFITIGVLAGQLATAIPAA